MITSSGTHSERVCALVYLLSTVNERGLLRMCVGRTFWNSLCTMLCTVYIDDMRTFENMCQTRILKESVPCCICPVKSMYADFWESGHACSRLQLASWPSRMRGSAGFWWNVFSYYRMCSLTTECVLLLKNMCSLPTEYVLLHVFVWPAMMLGHAGHIL